MEQEMPRAPLPMYIRVRLQTIKSQKELRRLLQTDYIASRAHKAWVTWAGRPELERKPPQSHSAAAKRARR